MWCVEVSGGPEDWGLLDGLFVSAALTMSKKDEVIRVTSSDFEASSDYGLVRELAADKVASLNGLMTLLMLPPFKLERVGEIDVSGAFRGRPYLEARLTVARKLSAEDWPAYRQTLGLAYEIALQEPTVFLALRYLDCGQQDWVHLYKVYELVNSDVNIVANGLASKSEVRSFRHHANDPRATGKASRHAVPNSPDPPTAPMTIAAANLLMKQIVGRWLSAKVAAPSKGADDRPGIPG
jgi:hypothetical protein